MFLGLRGLDAHFPKGAQFRVQSLRGCNSFDSRSRTREHRPDRFAEALLAQVRWQLAQSESISLLRDARRQCLVICYGLRTSDLDVHRGILGMVRDFGESAGDIWRGTREFLRRVCTRYACPPRYYADPDAKFMQKLFDHVRFQGLSHAFFFGSGEIYITLIS